MSHGRHSDKYFDDFDRHVSHHRKSSKKSHHGHGLEKVRKSKPTVTREKSHHVSDFNPVSFALSTQENYVLNKGSGYDIKFSTGLLEGSTLEINSTGNEITFHQDGSYKFEICGEVVPFSDVTLKVVFFSPSFSKDILNFAQSEVPKCEGKFQLRGMSAILPLQKGQKIVVRLIPNPVESLILMANTRLLIHRVA